MRYLKTLLIASLIVSVAMLDTPKAYAAYCDIGGFGRGGCVGFFTGATGSTSGYIGNVMSGGLYADSATEFINIVKGNLYGGDARNQMGGALVVDGMLGYGPFNTRDAGINRAKDSWNRFESLVRSYANTTKPSEYGVRWNVVRDPVRNSAYFGSINDMAFHEDSDGPSNVIEFYNNGKSFQVQRSCGNLVGEMGTLPEPENWQMDVSSTVNKDTAGPGKSVTFTHKVRNVGSTQSAVISGNVKWGSEGQNTGNVPGKDYSRRFDPGVADERVFTDDFTIPASAKDGWRYCQYVTADPRSDSNNSLVDSDRDNACVTVSLWRMKGESSANFGTRKPGQSVTFTHTVTNVGSDTTPIVSGEVRWGPTGVMSGAVSPSRTYSKTFNENESANRTYTYTIPAAARDGDMYCQYINWDKTSPTDGSSGRSQKACVQVSVPPETPQREVGVQPVVNGVMEYIEPTETAKFDGYVNITGFPQLWSDEWGYTEVATQRPAQRVTPTASSGLRVDGPYYTSMIQTSPGSTKYYCPHGNDTKISNSTCRHARPAYTKKVGCEAAGYTWSNGSCKSFHGTSSSYTPPTYACPATYQPISSSTCWRYRYKCAYDSSWGAWNGPAPNCKSYWTCPGGAAGSGWYYSAPNCQGWKCQYAPYTQVNKEKAPPCEYRCNNGAGLRAPQSNGWTGDMNCYIPPSFTLTCYWKNKPQFSQTVTGNGRYCDNRDMDADEVGVTIGTPVRARLTANYPGSGAWSSPPPGYVLNRQVTRWGWDNFPSKFAEDTVRVVAKPTVKIRGGDIAAGGSFKIVNTCTLTTTFSTIGGWPHSPVFDASGTEFAATASGNITGFATATLRGTARSTPPYALAFANTPRPSGDQFGRQFTSRMPCIYDHYGMKPATMPSLALNGITGAASGSYTAPSGEIGNDPIIQREKRVTVYVDGNVYISGRQGVRYNRDAPWTSTQDIPGFKLIVRGNIYIDPRVEELNGIYIAQPTSPGSTTTGNIYTCATSTGPVAGTSLYNNCRNGLTVNGAFLARKVHLLRTQGTAIRGETAEQFNYLPELWLTNWDTTDSSNELKYDSIISLPPVL